MANYIIPDNTQYDPQVRKLENTDPANAESTFNPTLSRMVENTAAVKAQIDDHQDDGTVHVTQAQKDNWDSKAGGEHVHSKDDITDFPVTFPPTGTAGGDLDGTYPNPVIKDEAIGEKAPAIVQVPTRANLVSGDSIKTIFGKVMKWFADLKSVAWSGSYADLSGRPSAFPPEAHTHDDRYYTEAEITAQLDEKAKEIEQLSAKVGRIEDMFLTGITKNPWSVEFADLDGLTVAGVWNTAMQRVEF